MLALSAFPSYSASSRAALSIGIRMEGRPPPRMRWVESSYHVQYRSTPALVRLTLQHIIAVVPQFPKQIPEEMELLATLRYFVHVQSSRASNMPHEWPWRGSRAFPSSSSNMLHVDPLSIPRVLRYSTQTYSAPSLTQPGRARPLRTPDVCRT